MGPMGVASMPMYDLPEVRGALDGLWNGLARHLRREGVAGVPDRIVHDRPFRALWTDPDLRFSQCCGYDLVNGYANTLQPIATPHFDAPECEGCEYASVIVVREDCAAADVSEMRGAVCAVNEHDSHSGMNALRALVAPASRDGRFFSRVETSGAHAASVEMVRNGGADIAAIDCVTYALLQRHRPAALSGVRKLCRTERAPALPYVTRRTVDADTVARMRTALFRTFADAKLTAAREALLLKDVEVIPVSAYRRITAFQDLAARHGFPRLN
jgi:ABC-type phosphate/phosphonate transport system substrate-binding protein